MIRRPPNEPGVTTHAYGGTRMGDNPETSVVDRWGFSHEVPNLGILGASVMGTSGARNPTETVQALAWRIGEYARIFDASAINHKPRIARNAVCTQSGQCISVVIDVNDLVQIGRAKIEPNPHEPTFIQTVRDLGYRFEVE